MNNIIVKLIDIGMSFSYMFKRYYYRKKLGISWLSIYFPIFISNPNNLIIGEDCAFASFVHIWSNEVVTIGKGTIIAAHVQISTSTHNYLKIPYSSERFDKSVTIGNNVWIGSGAIVMPGITIGDNAVFGAGSVVTKNIPENALAYGIPARIIKMLDHSNASKQ